MEDARDNVFLGAQDSPNWSLGPCPFPSGAAVARADKVGRRWCRKAERLKEKRSSTDRVERADGTRWRGAYNPSEEKSSTWLSADSTSRGTADTEVRRLPFSLIPSFLSTSTTRVRRATPIGQPRLPWLALLSPHMRWTRHLADRALQMPANSNTLQGEGKCSSRTTTALAPSVDRRTKD